MFKFLNTRASRLLWLSWFTLSLLTLVLCEVQIHTRDIDIVFYFFMMGLTFPIGFIILLGFSIFPNLRFFGIFPEHIELLVIWCILVTAGHIQWFVVVPRIFTMVFKKCE